MNSNNGLKEIDIKNRTCYYFSDIMSIEYFDFDNILIDENSNKNIAYQCPMRIRFDKVGGFIWDFDGTRYLVLFGPEKYDTIYVRMRSLISRKGSI